MTREPSFVLASGGSAVIAEGVHTAFPRIAEARAALASHSAPIILGALPFDMSKPAALIRPQAVQFLDELPEWPLRALPSVQVAETLPEPDEHRSRIATALERLRDPQSGLHKVVLARALRLVADGPLDARTILHRLLARGPGDQRLSRRPDSGGRRVLGHRTRRSQPRAAGGPAGRPHVLRAVRRFGTATVRLRGRRGKRRGVGGVGEEPSRTPARRRRGAARRWNRCAPNWTSRPSRC